MRVIEVTKETTVLEYATRMLDNYPGWKLEMNPNVDLGLVVIDHRNSTLTIHPNCACWTLEMNAAAGTFQRPEDLRLRQS